MRELTFIDATREALDEEMARDETIFVVGEGIGPRGGNFKTTVGLYDKYGEERLRDVPIAERGFIGMCTGAAMTGTRPVVDAMYFEFALDGAGEMINQTAKMQYMSSGRLKMPMIIRGAIGLGMASATHHSGNLYPIFAHSPGWKIALPSNPRDAKGLLKTALRGDDPVLFLEHKYLLFTPGEVPEVEADETIPFGVARVCREGSDLTIVAVSWMVTKALEAAETLAAEGISAEVIDPRTIAPLDIDTIVASVKKTGRLLVVDEDFAPFGVTSEISAQVHERAFADLKAPVRRLNGLHAPAPYSPPLEAAVMLDAKKISAAARLLAVEGGK
jgi:2-oxoisovalerate dehydrogenase E1 component